MHTASAAPLAALLAIAACDAPNLGALGTHPPNGITSAGASSTGEASTGGALDTTTTGAAESTGPIEGSTTTAAGDSSSGGESSTGGGSTGPSASSTGPSEGFDSTSTTGAEGTTTGDANPGPEQPPQFCTPGAVACVGESLQVCDDDGAAYLPPVACPAGETCQDGACLTACELAALEPSSVGCSFLAARLDNHDNATAATVIVGNISPDHAATVQLYATPIGSSIEAPEGPPVAILPGGVLTFTLTAKPLVRESGVRKGGTYRVKSDRPIVAYQHSPAEAIYTNDASLLLPEHTLAGSYVVASYPGVADQGTYYASYFHVIGTNADTVVKWTPPQDTLAGAGVQAVAAGATGAATIGRHDSLQVRPVAGLGDMSGTIITASSSIWVVGGTACANVPAPLGACDHLQEQLIPLENWGQQYVAAHSPSRGTEKHYWRVFGGADGVTVTTSPPQKGTPLALDRGEWAELVIPHGVSFIFDGDGPFMPVEYLAGHNAGAGTGDPAMYQGIPVEQYLSRYVFATGTGYNVNYAQVTRKAGGPEVKIDGATVTGYYPLGDFEVADFKIKEGAHAAESAEPFGVVVLGYKGATSYAYPGGLRLATINPQ